jgi:hypothetical protein
MPCSRALPLAARDGDGRLGHHGRRGVGAEGGALAEGGEHRLHHGLGGNLAALMAAGAVRDDETGQLAALGAANGILVGSAPADGGHFRDVEHKALRHIGHGRLLYSISSSLRS